MTFAVAWLGPVSAAQVAGATVPGASTTYVTCTGDGSPDCSQIGASIGAKAGGSIVRGLLAQAGVPDGELIIGSFSAGHEIAKPALMSAADRALVRAVLLADSTYTTWADSSRTRPTPPEGYVRFALDALRGNKLFVATASHNPAGAYPSGYATLHAVKDEVESRSGVQFRRVSTLPGVSVQPEDVWQAGNVWLAVFGPSVSHGQHATQIAPMVWQGLLVPWLSGGGSGGALARLLTLLVSGAAGWAATTAALRRLRRA